MIIYLCIKYESNILIFLKDIERKPFFVRADGADRTGRTGRTDVRMDSGDTLCLQLKMAEA